MDGVWVQRGTRNVSRVEWTTLIHWVPDTTIGNAELATSLTTACDLPMSAQTTKGDLILSADEPRVSAFSFCVRCRQAQRVDRP